MLPKRPQKARQNGKQVTMIAVDSSVMWTQAFDKNLKQSEAQSNRVESIHKDVRLVELCTLYLHTCQVRVTVGDSGLCCCTCVAYSEG